MDFKKQVNKDTFQISEEEIQNVPDIIKKEYELLKESIRKEDICGTLFRLKDIYEISMKLPSILAVISISSYIKDDNEFIRMTSEELKKEHEDFLSEKNAEDNESEALKKFGMVLSRLLREPLSIGSWRELAEIIVEHSSLFEINKNLQGILERTVKLHSVRPKKANSVNDRYEDVSNWRNKTIGHGTLLINTEDYWEQVYDLFKGLFVYFMGEEDEESLSSMYAHIKIDMGNQTNSDGKLIIGEKEYLLSEYIYSFGDEKYFFDSYYSRQNYTEITNYMSAPKRLKNNSYYQTLYSIFNATKKGRVKKKGRQITNSVDREMYACLNSAPSYEKPIFVIDEIKEFINKNDKGIIYIQMERGMGKSTLAHRLDGRYQKGILQKDLRAVVRVYHISDMMLRGENRTRDYFTAMNNNLISYEGGQLEVDNEEYIVDGKDLRQSMEGDGAEASMAFCQYLELFRLRYEAEIEDDDLEEVNLVYIIDGIDELNSDTFSILNTIPNGKQMQSVPDDLANHVYIVLLSRTKEEDNLPAIAKECIQICEDKANTVSKIDGNNKMYYQLLKKYITRNYKNVSEENACEIIESAQRKFLYIQPYMTMGNTVVGVDKKISPYEVAQNYINELQKLYCGTSLHTLQLIISSITVFHNISLKEICNLTLFTEVSYDIIGVLNDILPLLAIKRTDGENTYSFANEEYERFVYNNLFSSVCEVICRYRISLVSWLKRVDRKTSSYGKEWADYTKRALAVDSVAINKTFYETTEEYVRGLIQLYSIGPYALYRQIISEELCCDIITQIRQLKCKKLEVLTVKELSDKYISFSHQKKWYSNSSRLSYEYTQDIIQHCIEVGSIDDWFIILIGDRRISLESDYDSYDKDRLSAFKSIVVTWENLSPVIDYFCDLISEDMFDGRTTTYGAYLEELLPIVDDELLKCRIYEGLLMAYDLLAWNILLFPGCSEIDTARKSTILTILNEAESRSSLNNYDMIEGIKEVIFNSNVYDDTIEQLKELANKVYTMNPDEYIQEFLYGEIREKNLNEKQQIRYRQALVLNYRSMLDYMKANFDVENPDLLLNILMKCTNNRLSCFSDENSALITEYLDFFDEIIRIYAEKEDFEHIAQLSGSFGVFLKCYDNIIRQKTIGLYYYDMDIDEKQELTSWEITYALYCSIFDECLHNVPEKKGQIIATKFVNKYLQDLFEQGKLDQYYDLNNKLVEGYKLIDFRSNIDQQISGTTIRNYYRWITVRYYRSIEGKDCLTSDELYNWLKEEYDYLDNYIYSMLKNEESLVYKESLNIVIYRLSLELLCLAKMIPDSISSLEETRKKLLLQLEILVKNASNKREVKKMVKKVKTIILNPTAWCNTETAFVVSTTDRTIFN